MAIEKNFALLVIDMQNDFNPGGALAVEDGDKTIPVINSLTEKFSIVVATRDWHPENHVSFASNHPGKEPQETVEVNGDQQMLWPDHCVKTTKGAEFHPSLNIKPVTLILHKGFRPGLDSYSGFFENDHKTPTGLAGYLRNLDVKTVYVCGLATDYCVYFTVKDSLSLGFNTYLITDATKGVDVPENNVEKALEDMKDQGCTFITSRELLA